MNQLVGGFPVNFLHKLFVHCFSSFWNQVAYARVFDEQSCLAEWIREALEWLVSYYNCFNIRLEHVMDLLPGGNCHLSFGRWSYDGILLLPFPSSLTHLMHCIIEYAGNGFTTNGSGGREGRK